MISYLVGLVATSTGAPMTGHETSGSAFLKTSILSPAASSPIEPSAGKAARVAHGKGALAGQAIPLRASPGVHASDTALATGHELTVAPVNAFGFLPAGVSAKPAREPALTLAPAGSSRRPTGASAARPALTASAVTPGGVVLDGSLGQTKQPAIGTNSNGADDYELDASVGRQSGGNLFFSFSQLSLATGESATFSGPASAQNILARVTGGRASSIDGTLRSQIAGANLFLINPAGVMFGPNAALNLSGALVVTTADYVKFSDGKQYGSSLSHDGPVGSAPVSAFGFLSAAPKPVSCTGSHLTVPAGKSFSVIAGNILLDGATVTGVGSPVNLIGLKSSGEAQLAAADPQSAVETTQFSKMGEVMLTHAAAIDTSGPVGGAISIRGGSVLLRGGGKISSSTFGLGKGGNVTVNAQDITISGITPDNGSPSEILAESQSINQGGAAGDVKITATGQLNILDGGQISTSTSGLGQGGSVTVHAQDITISSGTLCQSAILSESNSDPFRPGSTGAAGDVKITANGYLNILGFSLISTSTSGTGQGGSVTVHAQDITISGSIRSNSDTPFSSLPGPDTTGAAGNLKITAKGWVNLLDGGEISSATGSTGKAGSVTVNAHDITISGRIFAGSFTYTGGGSGMGGEVKIIASSQLNILGGGQISTSTAGAGKGGSVTVRAHDITIHGQNPDPAALSERHGFFAGGILAESDSGAHAGAAGDVHVTATGSLNILGGGRISSSTSGTGQGGSVTVSSENITISGATPDNSFLSVILADSQSNDQGGGAGGNVKVTATGQLDLLGGGQISASTFGPGKGGSVVVNAHDITISGATPDHSSPSAILSASSRSGDAGSVSVSAKGTIRLDGTSTVSTSAVSVNAGSIQIEAGSDLRLSGGSGITASAGANGGNVTLQVKGTVYLLDSRITTTAGGVNLPSGTGGGQGGNITIDPAFIILDHSIVSANAAAGQGGNILLETAHFLSSESSVTATGSTAGTIAITAPELDLTNGLVQLSGVLIDASQQLREQCARRLDQDFSSFLVLGPGGTESAPDDGPASGAATGKAGERRAPLKRPKAGRDSARAAR